MYDEKNDERKLTKTKNKHAFFPRKKCVGNRKEIEKTEEKRKR